MPRGTSQLDAAILSQEGKEKGLMETYKELEDFIKSDPIPLEDDEDYLAVLEDEFEKFQEANELVLQKMLEGKSTELEYKAKEDSMRSTSRKVTILTSKVKRIMSKNVNSGSQNGNTTSSSKKLPKIELPKFSGDVRDWLPYWSQFKEIHESNSISDADKFQYLIQSTSEGSQAREIVMSFPIRGENYNDAVSQLEKMYGNEKMLVKVYIRDLLKLVIDNAQQKTTSLSSLYFKLSAKLKALETLKVTTDKCASVIYPMVESCLPEEVLRAWQRTTACQEATTGEEELKHLVEFLQKEVDSENNIRMACEGLKDEDIGKERDAKRNKKPSAPIPTAAALVAISQKKCLFCDMTNHESGACRKASKMTLKQREDIVKEKKACFKCLRTDLKRGHRANSCTSHVACLVCGGRHQTLLCRLNQEKKQDTGTGESDASKRDDPSSSSSSERPQAFSTLLNQCRSPDVMLLTIRVQIHGENGIFEGRALFDSGSHHSYVRKDVAEKVGMKKIGFEYQNHGVFGGGVTGKLRHVKYKVYLSAMDGSNGACFDVADCDQISTAVHEIAPGPWTDELEEKGFKIPDKGNKTTDLDLLIGADVFTKLITGRKLKITAEPGLDAWESLFGWTIVGKLSTHHAHYNKNSMMVLSLVNNQDIAKLWELDVIGITDSGEKKTRQELEEAALEHFRTTVKINEDGRYEVHLPFVEGHKPLPSNKIIAERRLQSTTTILKRDGTFEKYDELLKLWETMGMIEEVKNTANSGIVHYLPHRAVYKMNSETTPIRPVFDASCRARDQVSLNDCLEKGPNLVELIPALTTRMRMGKIGIRADVRKAFQQISVTPEHRDYQRFLWWTDPTCEEIKIYRHCRVVFGVSSSPFILGATLQLLFDQTANLYPETSKLLKKSFYVDNLVTSVSSKREADKLKEDAIKIMDHGKFELQEWEMGPNETNTEVPLLGMVWNTKEDILRIDVDHAMRKLDMPVTKRNILSLAHMIFDSIGVTAPFTLIPKFLLQELWAKNYGWDSELPEEVVKKFQTWRMQIPELTRIPIPRYVKMDVVPREEWKLFVFVDASQRNGYAACVYLKAGNEVFLIQAKARVKPLKELTGPRFELMSCVIGVRLARSVKEYVGSPSIKTTYFTDSSTALYWIQNSGNWGVFVQRRVQEILNDSDGADWRHIPGAENPADLPSRGGTVQQIIEAKFWLGPPWLLKDVSEWPTSAVNLNQEEIDAERREPSCQILTQWVFKLSSGGRIGLIRTQMVITGNYCSTLQSITDGRFQLKV